MMLILGMALSLIGYSGFIWVARQLQKSSIERSPFIGPLWPMGALLLMCGGLVIVFIKSWQTGLVLIAGFVLVRVLSLTIGSNKATRAVMLATYEAHKRSATDDEIPLTEGEILFRTLRSRDPFLRMSELEVRDIVTNNASIEELVNYVIEREESQRR